MEKKRLNNEGFSLIELIIVIAIMAILVGALAPQLVKYIERSRISADKQAIGALYTAVQTAIMDPSSNPDVLTTVTLKNNGAATPTTSAQKLENAIITSLGGKAGTDAIYKADNSGLVKLNSAAYGKVTLGLEITSEYAVTIEVPVTDSASYTGEEKGFKVTSSGAQDYAAKTTTATHAQAE